MAFLILIGYEALSLTVAMVIVSEWQIVSDDKFHDMPPRNQMGDLVEESPRSESLDRGGGGGGHFIKGFVSDFHWQIL